MSSCSFVKRMTPAGTETEAWRTYEAAPFLNKLEGENQRLKGRFSGELVQDERIFDLQLMINDDTSSLKLTSGDGTGNMRVTGKVVREFIKKHPSLDAYYIKVTESSFFVLYFKHYPQLAIQFFEKGKTPAKGDLRKLDI